MIRDQKTGLVEDVRDGLSRQEKARRFQKGQAAKDAVADNSLLYGGFLMAQADSFDDFISDSFPSIEEVKEKTADNIIDDNGVVHIGSQGRIEYDAGPVDGETWDKFTDHLLSREGYRNAVYKDSEGHLTVGVGHLVRPEDGLALGDTISDDQVHALLKNDAQDAYKAALRQAQELGITDEGMVVALGSVNFQLGTGWNREFSDTWAKMKEGDFEGAIANLEQSKWNSQTPIRVDDFQYAIAQMAERQGAGVDLSVAMNDEPSFGERVLDTLKNVI